jgi:hypothetical protein
MRTVLPLLVATIVAGSCLAGAASRLPALKAQRWVNSTPLTPEGLRGKVVLVDVWEYTCINWIRTLPSSSGKAPARSCFRSLPVR